MTLAPSLIAAISRSAEAIKDGAILKDSPRMFSYSAYGLSIESELVLSELSSGRERAPDVIIRTGRIGSFDPNIDERTHRADENDIRFSYETAGRFRVRQGSEIVVDSAPNADDSFLRACLLGPVLAALLHQRGLLVLHGSAITKDGRAITFLGGKGWGKSTLAAYMNSRGHGFLTDDVVAVNADSSGVIQLMPGFPHLKLWPNSAAYLGMDPDKMARLHPELDKRIHRLDDDFSMEPCRISSIYVLDIGDYEEIRPIKPREALIELVRHTYLSRYLQPTGTASLHLQQCAKVASSVPLYYLRRPPSLFRLPKIARLVEDHVADPVC
jgi:hypothetical protein